MKRIDLLMPLLILLTLSAPAFSKDQAWQVVSIPGICTYQIPPTVEIQNDFYRKLAKQRLDEVTREFIEINDVPNKVVAQQKGINSFNPKAYKRYCRIIVVTERGKQGEFQDINEPLALSPEELKQVDAVFKQEAQAESKRSQSTAIKMKILTWNRVKIVRVSEADALKVSYTRSVGGAPPVLVNMYIIQNDDLLHKIYLSYRISEKDIWAKDFEKVIESFKFVKR